MALLTEIPETILPNKVIHHMPETHDDLDEFEMEASRVINGMEEVEAWPIEEVLSELIRTGFISEDEIILHEEL